MTTLADVEQFRLANQGITAMAQLELEDLWGSLDLSFPGESRDSLLAFVPGITEKYGNVSALVAADWYDDLRPANSLITGAFRAPLASPVPASAVASTVRFGASHLWSLAPALTLALVSTAVNEYVLRPGRQTIAQATRQDPSRPRWARVPSGKETCAFCLTMASRGFVYGSEAAASFAGSRFEVYHGACDCVPTPEWSDDPRIDGYDPDGMYDMYLQARAEAGVFDLAGRGTTENDDLSILQAMRRLYPDQLTDGVKTS